MKKHYRNRLNKIVMLFLLTQIGCYSIVFSQSSNFNPKLNYGKYSIGIKVINQYDKSRIYNPYNNSGENLRPIQTLIWYPAYNKDKTEFMLYKEYIHLFEKMENFKSLSDADKDKIKKEFLPGYEGKSDETVLKEMEVSTKAVNNAIPLEGSFPIIIYAPSYNSMPWENSDLCEYFASYGYIVVASPSFGRNSWDMTYDVDGLTAQADDIEFLVKFMKDYPNSDYSKIGIAGYSWGGMANIIAAQKIKNIKAVLSIDGSIIAAWSKFSIGTPYLDPAKMEIPYMSIRARPKPIKDLIEKKWDTTFVFYESLTKTDAYSITLNKMARHAGFFGSAMKLTDIYAGMDETAKKETLYSYELMCEYALTFFNAQLKNNISSKKWLQNPPVKNGISEEYVLLNFKLKK
jgi:dienelactone hydrolase